MKKAKACLCVLTAVGCVGAISTIGILNCLNNNVSRGGADVDYSLLIDQSKAVTTEQIAMKEATYKTSLGNDIRFTFDGMVAESGKYGSLDGVNSFIETRVNGVTSVEFSIDTTNKAAYAIYTGSEKTDAKEEYRYVNNDGASGEHTEIHTVTFNSPVNYVRLENIGQEYDYTSMSKVAINSIKFNYSCEEVPVRELLEARSNCLLFGSNVSFDRWDLENAPLDFTCTDTANANSGYSLYCKANDKAKDWPCLDFNLKEEIDLLSYGLVFNVKFNVTYPYLSMVLFDSEGAAITKVVNLDFKVSADWQKHSVLSETFIENLAEGRKEDDLARVKTIRIGVNFDTYKGKVQEFWLDDVHLLEQVGKFGFNMENIALDIGDSQTTPQVDYTEHKGNKSHSSMKLTFEKSKATETGDEAVSTSFSTEAQWGTENPILNSGTLEFDIKPSLNIVNSTTSKNKHMVSINIIGTDWTACGDWVDLLENGKWGYITSNSTDGWYHFSVDLSKCAKISACKTPNIRIKIGVFGVSTANQDSAFVYLDNINWSPAV